MKNRTQKNRRAPQAHRTQARQAIHSRSGTAPKRQAPVGVDVAETLGLGALARGYLRGKVAK